MRILVLQLARLGDIYLTWPCLQALREKYPQAQIHLLVRSRFREACYDIPGVDCVWCLDSKKVLKNSFSEEINWPTVDQELSELLSDLKSQAFDQIFNFTYSPLSSYLTYAISKNSKITGYSRHSDGYLHIPDDASAYFYAQAGVDKDSRLHLADFFAVASDLDLRELHWLSPAVSATHWLMQLRQPYFVIHVGASDRKKTLSAYKWRAVVKNILKHEKSVQVVLVGSKEEAEFTTEIVAGLSAERVINLVGRTRMADLFPIIGGAEILIGADSAPIHVASLTQTRVLNLSFPHVNFWETGPKSVGSRILFAEAEQFMPSDMIASEALKLWQNQASEFAVAEVDSNRNLLPTRGEDFRWQLLRALYMSEPCPAISDPYIRQGLTHLADVNDVALEQIETLKTNIKNTSALNILNTTNEVFTSIASVVPDLGPIVRWLETEKIRLGPQDSQALLEQTQRIHSDLKQAMQTLQVQSR